MLQLISFCTTFCIFHSSFINKFNSNVIDLQDKCVYCLYPSTYSAFNASYLLTKQKNKIL